MFANFVHHLKIQDRITIIYVISLPIGASLCFTIDTTGSMSNEIDAVIAETIAITQNASAGPNPPSDYVLVPFNDPGNIINVLKETSYVKNSFDNNLI